MDKAAQRQLVNQIAFDIAEEIKEKYTNPTAEQMCEYLIWKVAAIESQRIIDTDLFKSQNRAIALIIKDRLALDDRLKKFAEVLTSSLDLGKMVALRLEHTEKFLEGLTSIFRI
jgi:hypothetical protein